MPTTGAMYLAPLVGAAAPSLPLGVSAVVKVDVMPSEVMTDVRVLVGVGVSVMLPLPLDIMDSVMEPVIMEESDMPLALPPPPVIIDPVVGRGLTMGESEPMMGPSETTGGSTCAATVAARAKMAAVYFIMIVVYGCKGSRV